MTTNAERKISHSSFCASCGKPVRWEANDKRRNEEFCPECEPYAAKIVTIDMKIEAFERRASGTESELIAQIEIEKMMKERDFAIRMLDTIRTGWLVQLDEIVRKEIFYRRGKPVAN